MSNDAPKATPPPLGESGVRSLRVQLIEQKKVLESLQKKNSVLGDELEDVTVRLLRAEAELATAKHREVESAKQWLVMSSELAAARARVTKHERLLERVTEMLDALNDRARGSVLESEIDAIVGVLELHRPERED